MSGAGRTFATADEAAAGAVDVVKDSIQRVQFGTGISPLFTAPNNCVSAVINTGTVCTTDIQLPGTLGGTYQVSITLENLFTRPLPGSRLEFARSAGGAPTTTIFYRITTRAVGPNNTTAENSALYRFSG
jgi:hypothetical protein